MVIFSEGSFVPYYAITLGQQTLWMTVLDIWSFPGEKVENSWIEDFLVDRRKMQIIMLLWKRKIRRETGININGIKMHQ